MSVFPFSSEGHRNPAEAESPYDVIVLSVIPSFHIYGMMIMLTVLLLSGARVISLPRFHPEQYLAAIEKYRVNIFKETCVCVHIETTGLGMFFIVYM